MLDGDPDAAVMLDSTVFPALGAELVSCTLKVSELRLAASTAVSIQELNLLIISSWEGVLSTLSEVLFWINMDTFWIYP